MPPPTLATAAEAVLGTLPAAGATPVRRRIRLPRMRRRTRPRPRHRAGGSVRRASPPSRPTEGRRRPDRGRMARPPMLDRRAGRKGPRSGARTNPAPWRCGRAAAAPRSHRAARPRTRRDARARKRRRRALPPQKEKAAPSSRGHQRRGEAAWPESARQAARSGSSRRGRRSRGGGETRPCLTWMRSSGKGCARFRNDSAGLLSAPGRIEGKPLARRVA